MTKPLRFFLRFVLGTWALLAIAYADGCTPAQRAAIPAEERAVCVLLTAADPAIAPYCATADELAPLVPVLAQQAFALEQAPDAGAPARPVVAFTMPAPRHARPRLRCGVAPVLTLDAGALEAP